DAAPSSNAGPWSERFLSTAVDLLSDWMGLVATDLSPAEPGALSATLEASLQEILVLATDLEAARDTRSFIDATLRARAPANGGRGRPGSLEQTRSATGLDDMCRLPSDVNHPARILVERLARGRDARPTPRGEMAVVFASPSGGFLLHEVCGHLLE